MLRQMKNATPVWNQNALGLVTRSTTPGETSWAWKLIYVICGVFMHWRTSWLMER